MSFARRNDILSLISGHGSSSVARPKGVNSDVCVVVAIRSAGDGNTHLVLLAVTTQSPQAGRVALEIPDIERRRAGLGDLKQSWIVIDEYNYDIV